MSEHERKLEPPLRLDMSFGEALERLAQTDPAEVEPPKGGKPKLGNAAKRLASLGQPDKKKPAQKRQNAK